VSNPPYFVDSSKASEEARTLARHADLLPFADLVSCGIKLLHPDGRFCIILPSKEAELFRDIAEKNKLYLNKLTRVRTRADKPSDKRLLMQFERKRKSFSENSISIEKNNSHDYTDEYKELTRDFYLAF
jgi:tRNA1Val (adenine37-N6)-methyltransferase